MQTENIQTQTHEDFSSDFEAAPINGESVETVGSSKSQNDHELYAPLFKEVTTYVERFMPREALIELIMWSLVKHYKVIENETAIIANNLIERALLELKTNNLDWSEKLDFIFKEEYPVQSREYWNNNHFVQKKYKRNLIGRNSKVTFSCEEFDPIRPSKTLATRMAPALIDIIPTKKGKSAQTTPELARFLNGEKLALPKSSLYEIVASDRPKYRDKNSWETEIGKLPRKQLSAKINISTYEPTILNQLVQDLRSTFAWPADNDATLAIYLGYLIQPLVSYLKSGQMPGYSFQGPSRCGKGYLSSVLVGIIYNRLGGQTVISKMLPSSTYELEVYLNDMRHALYIVFDEVVHATEEQLVILNSLLTQQTIQVRKFGVGYQKLENLMTISLTSVGKNFSDETEGRLAIVKLIQSRPEEIDKFHERWVNRGAELLAALVGSINNIEFENQSISQVSQRRPGFALISHCIENMFQLKPDYSLQTSENETLDDLCEMYFSKSNDAGESDDGDPTPTIPLGRSIGKRYRYSVKNFCDFLGHRDRRAYRRKEIFSSLLTALSYRSTIYHPIYKERGYLFRWEKMDRYCHIEFQEESSKVNKRHWIYIQDVTPIPEKALSSDETFNKNLKLLEMTQTKL